MDPTTRRCANLSRGGKDGGTPPPRAVVLSRLGEVEVVVEKLVAGGEGLARYRGVPIFIPLSAPGDRLRVTLVERWPDYGRAEIVEILEPGPGRRKPPCPHFRECGGCDLQHLEDGLQPRLKAEALLETLRRLGGIELASAPEVVVGEPFGYRLRTQLRIGGVEAAPAVGYRARRSHRLVPVDRCPVLVSELERLLPRLRELLGAAAPRRLDLLAAGGRVSCAPVVEGLPHGEVEIEVGGFTYHLDARCFFQAHRGLVGELVRHAVGGWEGERACDLYAGVGLFTLPLARRYGRVVAVEGDAVAVRYARRNARLHGLAGVEVVTKATESWVRQLPEGVDRVIVDPPRGGLPAAVSRALCLRPPSLLTYVSCHPAALARDLKALSGTFAVRQATLLDLFPQTGHLEAVLQLVRR